jgi:hypothetical protein
VDHRPHARLVTKWVAAAYLVAAACVWWDAHRLDMTYDGPGGRDGSLGAPGWAMLTLVMAPIAVTVYLFRRRRWLPEAGEAGSN